MRSTAAREFDLRRPTIRRNSWTLGAWVVMMCASACDADRALSVQASTPDSAGGAPAVDPAAIVTKFRDDTATVSALVFETEYLLSGYDGPLRPVNMKVTDPAVVRTIYSASLALPVVTHDDLRDSCSNDVGVTYLLTFSSVTGSTLLDATLDATGCQRMAVSGMPGSVLLRATDPAYWKTLATGLGVPISDL
jgi:hypothetical protein